MTLPSTPAEVPNHLTATDDTPGDGRQGDLVTPTEIVVRLLQEDPHGWAQGDFSIRHRSGVEVWSDLGLIDLSLYAPVKASFGPIGKLRVWLAIRRMAAARVQTAFDEVGE